MSFEEDQVTMLTAGMSPLAIVPDVISEDEAFPVLVWTVLEATHGTILGGASGLADKRVLYIIASHAKLDVINYAEQLRLMLHGYKGTMGSTVVLVCVPVPSSERDDYQQPEDAGDQGVYQRQVEYTWRYREEIPTFS